MIKYQAPLALPASDASWRGADRECTQAHSSHAAAATEAQFVDHATPIRYGQAEISTPEHLAEFLLSNGCDPKEFDVRGGKSLLHLFQEILLGETFLQKHEANLVRHVVSAAILIEVSRDGYEFNEVNRTFPGGRFQAFHRPWTIRETVRVGEEEAFAAQRGLGEELDFWNRVHFATREQLIYQGTNMEPCRPSEAYDGLFSQRRVHRFKIDLPALPWPKEVMSFEDRCSTRITIQRFVKGTV